MYTTVAGCSTQLRGSTGLPPKRGHRRLVRLLGSAAEALMNARLEKSEGLEQNSVETRLAEEDLRRWRA